MITIKTITLSMTPILVPFELLGIHLVKFADKYKYAKPSKKAIKKIVTIVAVNSAPAWAYSSLTPLDFVDSSDV